MLNHNLPNVFMIMFIGVFYIPVSLQNNIPLPVDKGMCSLKYQPYWFKWFHTLDARSVANPNAAVDLAKDKASSPCLSQLRDSAGLPRPA